MNPRSASLLLAVALACGSAAANAAPLGDRASIELFGGTNAGMPGSFRATDNVQPTPNGSTVYENLAFDDAYRHSYTAGAEFDYAFDSRLSAFARGAYSRFNGANHRIGQFFANDAGVEPVMARFDETTTRSFDLGARYTFAPDAKLRPFIGAGLGVANLSAVRAMINNPGTVGATNVALARGDDVFEQRIETGLQWSPARNFDLRLTAAALHVDGQRPSNDPNLAVVGLTSDHGDVPGRWDYPAELGAVWHF